MFFVIPFWLQLVFFMIGNLPEFIKIYKMIKELLEDVPDKKEKKAIIEMCKDDIEAYKKHRDMSKLRIAMAMKKTEAMKANARKKNG